MTDTTSKLKQRGIYDSAVLLGCTIEGDKLFIPIRTLSGAIIAKRVKNFGDGLKYFWSPSKPSGNAVDWFIAPKTRQAIANNNGVAYLANGEPAMLAMIAAGVTNVISTTLSEISVPKNIIDMFGTTCLDIKELRYLKDKDEAGQISAINWRDALLTSDVKFTAYDMPDYLADKADINDLWIYHGFSSGQFRDALETLYKAMLPLPEVKPVIEYDTELADTPQALIDAIISRLGIQHFNNDGWSSKKVVSPFRADDENASFNLNRNTGVGGDWGTGEYHSPYAIAKELNIEYSKPSQKQEIQYSPDKLESAFKEYLENMPAPIEYVLSDTELLPGGRKSWINQDYLPKSWIQAILTLTDTRSAVATLFIKLHHAFQTGALNSNNFTLKQIRDTLYDGKRRPSTKAALDSLINLKVVRDNGAYSIYKEIPNKPLQLEIIDNPALIGLNFLDMLDRYILEQHTSKALAPRLSTLIHDLDLSLDDAKQWHDRCKDLISPEIEYRIKADKRYWLEELAGDNRHDAIDYDIDFDNVDLRAALLTDYLNKQVSKEIQMSQPEIMRLCGLKSASFKPVFKVAGVVTELKFKWHQIKKPNSCDLKYELTQATQAKNNDGRGGHLVWMQIKPVGGKYGKPIYKMGGMISKWEQLKSGSEEEPRIFGINIRVQLPSLVRFKTGQEIADEIKEAQRKALEKAQEESIVILPDIEDNSTVRLDRTVADEFVLPTADKPRRKPSYKATADRSWDKHDDKWLYTQLQAEVYCWLNENIYKSGLVEANDIIRYINEQIILRDIDKPFHSAETFFDSDVLDYGVDTMPEEPTDKDSLTVANADKKEIPLPTLDKPTRIKLRMNLVQTRAWAKAEDKPAYLKNEAAKQAHLESIGAR